MFSRIPNTFSVSSMVCRFEMARTVVSPLDSKAVSPASL